MNELTTEQKAQRYDKAIEATRKLIDAGLVYEDAAIQIFPELKESEDERIKKAVSDILLIDSDEIREILEANNLLMQDIDVWLKKQGKQKSIDNLTQQEAMDIAVAKCFDEQKFDNNAELKDYSSIDPDFFKTTDKVESKFHEGDWIVENIDASTWLITKVFTTEENVIAYNMINQEGRTLTIGSHNIDYHYHLWTIQDAKDGDILVFKNNIGDIIICKSPTNYDTRSYCRLVGSNFISKEESGWDSTLLAPATKEERYVLMRVIVNKGYIFDFENKKLKKTEQKSSWSEKDERIIGQLTSLWSEVMIEPTCCRFGLHKDEVIHWLESLRSQNRWKPSDEQMEVLLRNVCKGGENQSALASLYNDLKKL